MTEQITETFQNNKVKELFFPASPIQQIFALKITLDNVYNKGFLSLPGNNETNWDTYRTLIKGALSNPELRDDPNVATKMIRACIMLFDRDLVDEIATRKPNTRSPLNSTYFRESGEDRKEVPGIIFPNNPIKVVISTLSEKNKIKKDIQEVTAEYHHIPDIPDYLKPFTPVFFDGRTEIAVDSMADIQHKLPSGYIYYDKPTFLFLSRDVNYADLERTSHEFLDLVRKRADADQLTLVLPFTINQHLGGFCLYRGSFPEKQTRLANHFPASKTFLKLFYPISEIPRQEVWKVFLSKGIPLFQESLEQVTDIQISDESTSGKIDSQEWNSNFKKFLENSAHLEKGEEGFKRMAAHKMGVYINLAGRNENAEFDNFVQNTVEHMRRNFGREHPVFGIPGVILTRSGVSANESAMRAVASTLAADSDDSQQAYVFPGWYYENNVSLELFKTTTDLDKARVFLINYEPSYANLGKPEDYARKREEILREVVQIARAQPNQRFYIIFDKTSNPNASSFHSEGILTPNLSFLETMSLTKHQRGGKNYFYGTVFSWSDPTIYYHLNNGIITAKAALSPMGLIHFPRITTSEVVRNIKKLKLQQGAISEVFSAEQQGIFQGERWNFEGFSYFGYVIPPFSQLLDNYLLSLSYKERRALELALEGKVSNGEFRTLEAITSKRKINDIMQKVATKINDIMQKVANSFPDIELGDSFGLNKARLNSVPAIFKAFGQEFNQNVPRLSYGLQVDPEMLRNYMIGVFKELREKD